MERRDSAKENVNPLKYMEDLNADMSVDSLAPELAESMPKEQATEISPKKEPLLTDQLSNNETDLGSESIDLSHSLGPALVGTSSFETTPTAQAFSSDRTQSPLVQVQSSLGEPETDLKLAGILGDVTNQQKPFLNEENSDNKVVATSVRGNATDSQLSGDSSQSGVQNIREAEEYADDLARELIDDMTHQQQPRDDQDKFEPELEQEAEPVSRKEIDHLETIEDAEIVENQQEEEEEEAETATISSTKRQSSVNSETFDGHKVSERLPIEEQDSAVAKLVNKTSNTTNVFDAHQSFQTAAGNSLIDCDSRLLDEMEFTKNYSDDLLMGRNDGSDQQGEIPSGGTDLADFELPPYSGSSSGSEQPPKQHSPTKRKSSSSSSAQQASSSQHVSVAPPNLAAVKNLLLSSYSRVSHVFHWKKPIESGVFFAIGITFITALTFFSIISVVAYTALGAIFASSLIRVYKAVMKTLKRSQETPFDQIWDKILSINVSMSPEKMHELVDVSLGNFNASLIYFKQVLLVEDKFATLKFGLFLYLLTYIGSYFNGMTLITISYLALFSVPVFYEKNKANIDEYLNLVTGQISTTASLITNKVSSLVFGSSPVPSTSGIKKQE